MAISNFLLQGGLTFKINLDKEGGGEGRELKYEDFSGDVIYGWPLLKHVIALVKVEVRQKKKQFFDLSIENMQKRND